MSTDRGRLTVGRLFGVPVHVHPSWLVLFVLIVISLTQLMFAPELGGRVEWYVPWLLGTVAAVGLFASLLAHELCHSLVARRLGMPVSGITLFIFGGVSQLGDEPPTAAAEFMMAAVGPLSSLLIGSAFLALWLPSRLLGWSPSVQALLRCLFYVNFFLAGFNTLPAFPLDGGRILRSVLWGVTGDLRLATQVAARIGSFFAFGMMTLGLLGLLTGAGIGAAWPLVLGFFLRLGARSSLRMVMMRESLAGLPVRRLMNTGVVSVPRGLDVQTFVESCVFGHLLDQYPVVDEAGHVVGLVRARAPKNVPRADWATTSVGALMEGLTQGAVLHPDADAARALALLSQQQEGTLLVVEDGKPIGTLGLRDLLRFLALTAELGPQAAPPRALPPG